MGLFFSINFKKNIVSMVILLIIILLLFFVGGILNSLQINPVGIGTFFGDLCYKIFFAFGGEISSSIKEIFGTLTGAFTKIPDIYLRIYPPQLIEPVSTLKTSLQTAIIIILLFTLLAFFISKRFLEKKEIT